MDLSLESGTALLDGLDVTVNISESVFEFLQGLLILLLLLLCLFEVERFVHKLFGKHIGFRR
jgi:hypothetical protein